MLFPPYQLQLPRPGGACLLARFEANNSVRRQRDARQQWKCPGGVIVEE